MAEDKSRPSGANKYSVYAQRSVDSTQVNWNEISGNLVKGLDIIRAERDAKKAAIEKATQESIEQLSKVPETGTQDAASLLINGSAMSVEAIRTQNNLMKRGLISPKDNMLFMQQQKTGYKSLSAAVKGWDDWAVEARTRLEDPNISSGNLETFTNLQTEALGNLKNKKLWSNPTNGKMQLVTMGKNSKSGLYDVMPDYETQKQDYQDPNTMMNFMKYKNAGVDVNNLAKKQTTNIAEIVKITLDGAAYKRLTGGGRQISKEDFRQLGDFGSDEQGNKITYKMWKTINIDAMVGDVTDTSNINSAEILTNAGYGFAQTESQFNEKFPGKEISKWIKVDMSSGQPVPTMTPKQMKQARRLADVAIESQVSHIEKVAEAAKSAGNPVQPNTASLNKAKDDAMLIGFMDGVNSLVSDDASKFDAEANDRIVALNKGQTDPARRIDSIVRDDDEILITYQDGKVEPVNRLDDNGNPKSARVISQELWRFVTDQSDDSFKYAADLYAKEPEGGFRSTTRESTDIEDLSFIANERAVKEIGPAPVLVELTTGKGKNGKPTNNEISLNAEAFKKESNAYALKLKAEIESQGENVTALELDNMKRLILTGGDASKYASLAPFAEVTSSSQQNMIMGEGKTATMVSPTVYMEDKIGPNLGIMSTEEEVQTVFSEVFTNFLPEGFKNGATLRWDDDKNQVIITYKDNQNNDVRLPPIQMSETYGDRTGAGEATEMLRKAAVDVLKVENEIRTSRNRKGVRKTRVNYKDK